MRSKLLFKNCINNQISVSILFENNKKIFISKTTFSNNNYIDLENEFKGFKWYSSYKKINVFFSEIKKLNQFQLNIEYIHGSKIKYNLGLIKNYESILSSIKYYNSIIVKEYSKTKKYPIHGDFSLDNIIFNKKDIAIVDWQHFTLLDSFRGFDILNLIFEQLYFDYYKKNFIFSNRYKIFHKLLSLIRYVYSQSMIDDYFLDSPLMKTREFINYNKEKIWNEQINKLPVIKFKDKDVSFIDNYIKSNIN